MRVFPPRPDFFAPRPSLVLDFALDLLSGLLPSVLVADAFADLPSALVEVSAAGGVDLGAGAGVGALELVVDLGRCGDVFAGASIVGGAYAYTGSEASTLTKTTPAAKRRRTLVNA